MQYHRILLAALFMAASTVCLAQAGLPADYLPASFHAERRDSLRRRMPAHSVAVVFAYPVRTFSNDVSYPYHPNPDLYYFSGYREPNAVLLVFKEEQTAPDHTTYKDLFFIQRRDAQAEQWTGRRMGVEAVKKQLGFTKVYDGAAFDTFPIDFAAMDNIFFDKLPADVANDRSDSADLFDLLQSFKRKAALPEDYNPEINDLLFVFDTYVNTGNMAEALPYLKKQVGDNDMLRNHALIKALLACKDAADIASLKQQIHAQRYGSTQYTHMIASLREIKTPEEMVLLRKSIAISSIAHAEAMKAIEPGMSELELQGLQEYIHKKLGAEYVGYPSIVGSGENGCVLHYEENTRTRIGQDMVLMDIGSEYHGYSADVTRTVPSNGRFTPVQKAIYNLVYEAQEAVFKLCKEGTLFAALNAEATTVLADGLLKLGIIKDRKEVERYYPHGCSHFLGLDVHDAGNYNQYLKENMVITVEPGIYIPANSPCDKKWWGIAVRIEDDVRIGRDAPELLSFLAPRKAEEVEKMAAQKSALNNLLLPPVPGPASKKGF